jgi:hypothetical protein
LGGGEDVTKMTSSRQSRMINEVNKFHLPTGKTR